MPAIGQLNSLVDIVAADTRLHKLGKYGLTLKNGSIVYSAGNTAMLGLSGVTYNPLTHTLFFLTQGQYDIGNKIMEYTLDGKWLRTITLTGFEDTESIAWMHDDYFVVSEEFLLGTVAGRLNFFQITAATTTIERTTDATSITPAIDAVTTNEGIEAVTYDPDADKFYFTTEKAHTTVGNPWWLYSIPRAGGAVTQVADLKTLLSGVATDISGMHYDRQLGRFFLLSHESAKVIEMQTNGTIITTRTLTDMGAAFMTQPEGIAMTPGGGDMWIVGEPDDYARFSLAARPRPNRTTKVALGSNYTLTGASAGLTGFTITLPAKGTYLLIASILVEDTTGGQNTEKQFKFRDITHSVDVGSVSRVRTSSDQNAGSGTGALMQATLMEPIEVTEETVIQVFGHQTVASNFGTVISGNTTLQYLQLST